MRASIRVSTTGRTLKTKMPMSTYCSVAGLGHPETRRATLTEMISNSRTIGTAITALRVVYGHNLDVLSLMSARNHVKDSRFPDLGKYSHSHEFRKALAQMIPENVVSA